MYIQASIFMFLPLGLPNNIIILLGGASAFLLTYVLTFGVIAFCRRTGFLDKLEERKIHTIAKPRLGGVAIFATFLIASLLFYMPVLDPKNPQTQVIFGLHST